MSFPLDEITRKKLVIVRQIHQRAIVQSQLGLNPVDRILAVVGLDLAIETELKAVVTALEASKPPSDSFQGLVQQADTLLGAQQLGQLSDQAHIQHIHSIRNDAQHKARYPNEIDVADCRTYCRDFLNATTKSVWGTDLSDITLATAIRDDRARNELTAAERMLHEGKTNEAVQAAAASLAWSMSRVAASIVGRLPGVLGAIKLEDASGKPAPRNLERAALTSFQHMRETLLRVALRMDFAQEARYRLIVGDVFFTVNDEVHFDGMKPDIDSAEAEWTVAYCVDRTPQIEDLVGSLEAPFGINWNEWL